MHPFHVGNTLTRITLMRTYSANLVKEFYASIALDENELEKPADFADDGLNVFLNGKKFVVKATDLGSLLKVEYEEGEYEILEGYDPSFLWEIIIGKKERYSSKSYASFIKSPQIRILHYFIASTIHGRSGSFSYAEGDEPESGPTRKSPTLKPKNEEESNEGTKVIRSFNDDSSQHDEAQPDKPSPTNFEEILIMAVFHQMVREEEAEREGAKGKAQKQASPRDSPKLVHATKKSEQSDKRKGKTAASTEDKPKPIGKGRKTMATKTKILKRRKSSRIVDKAKPSVKSSVQDLFLISDKSSSY
ncbi:hypothetical protein QQP08_016621 [Theobroma cacao]|nr:hypothetical protein QQP08_016621 [Theobroma cacao]